MADPATPEQEEHTAAPEESPPTKDRTAAGAGDKPAAKPARRRRWPWLVLLLIIAAAGGAWLLPAPQRAAWLERLTTRAPQEREAPAPTPKPATTPAVVKDAANSAPQPAPRMQETPPAIETPEPNRVSTSAPPVASSAEVQSLLDAMHALQTEIQHLREQTAALREALARREWLDLRDRLRHIAAPNTLLPDMASDWREISLIPRLNDEERDLASRMQALAEQDAAKLSALTGELERLAKHLPVARSPNVLPQPGQPWLANIVGRFELRRAASADARADATLRHRLLRTARNLATQNWPDAATWRHLLMDIRERFGEATELNLPSRLEDLQEDASRMHETASSWLRRL